jgi:hypothetical protein
MAQFLQDRSCNDDFYAPVTTHIVDNRMDIEGEDMVNKNNNEEIIININMNDDMDVEMGIVQENKKIKTEVDELEEDVDELEEDGDELEEDGDIYQHVALLEAENEDLRQQLENAHNIIPSRIPFPDDYHIGFDYVNGVRYLFVYQQPQPFVDNGPLSLADLQCDDEEEEEEEEKLSLIRPDDNNNEDEEEDESDDNDRMDISK